VETDGVMGPFVNTVVLRTWLGRDATFSELLRRVRETVLGADAHQDLPFEKVVEAVRPPRDPSRNPLFQVNFRVMTDTPPLVKLPGLVSSHRVSPGAISKFDLALELWVLPGRFGGYWEYSTDLFERTTVMRMCAEFEQLLRAVLAQPNTRLNELDVLREIRGGRCAREQAQKAKPEQLKGIGLRDIRRKALDLHN
jgi:non-ribosomal peptide synthetase component F